MMNAVEPLANTGSPILALVGLLILGVGLFFFLRPKADKPPLSGDDHSEPF